GTPNVAPTAAFTATPAGGDAPLSVDFDATGSGDSDGSITTYAWDFGDQSSGGGAKVQHVYTAPGAYSAILTVTDDRGGTDVATQIISVVQPPSPPVAHDDALDATPAGALDVLANDEDAEGGLLTLSDYTQPAHGT